MHKDYATKEERISFASELHEKAASEADHAKCMDLWTDIAADYPAEYIAVFGMGTSLACLGQIGSAIQMLTRAAELNPEHPVVWCQLGAVLRNAQHTELAESCYERCLSLDPNNPEGLIGMAGNSVNAGNPDRVIEYSRKALKFIPDSVHALNNLSLGLLEKGEWQEGWDIYCRRESVPGYDNRDMYDGLPRWDGKSHVKKMAIHAEQGIGDELLFASGINEILPFADEVVGEVAGRLLPCFRRTWPDINWYATHQEVMYHEGKDLEAWFRMGDIPSLFRRQPKDCPGTPYIVPYRPAVEGYRKRLKELGDGPYVGFAWRGGTQRTHERVRNAPMSLWRDLLDASSETVTPVSVQYGQWGEGSSLSLPHWSSINDNVDELMSLIAACDLIITCNQTAVHMAGSMGIPCWTATPKEAAWRYCHEVDGHMCWYNSVKIYRGEWENVFKRLTTDLRGLSQPAAAVA